METPNLPFSILGVSDSGKTNYITVMLHELGSAAGLKLAVNAQNTETSNHQEKNRKSIYENHTIPDSTTADEVFPQIWWVKNLAKRRGNVVPTYTFTIFDGAGETHEDKADAPAVGRYINLSKAMIITIDPLVLDGVRRNGNVNPTIIKNSLSGRDDNVKSVKSREIVNDIADKARGYRNLESGAILKMPVAVVLTKFDTVWHHSIFQSEPPAKNPGASILNGGLDIDRIKGRDDAIRAWLQAVKESEFLTALEANFDKFMLFGVSSYGNPPKEVGKLGDISPNRVLDPILWLFHSAKFID
ncbi:hypothetical protein AGMMS49975_09900 [Clostridia bacterium]|nr:hypothetical protein AGMMS49975_09900 [Clostridia bacterium]